MKFEEEVIEKMLNYKNALSENLSEADQKEIDSIILNIVKEHKDIITFIDKLENNHHFLEQFKIAFEDIKNEKKNGK